MQGRTDSCDDLKNIKVDKWSTLQKQIYFLDFPIDDQDHLNIVHNVIIVLPQLHKNILSLSRSNNFWGATVMNTLSKPLVVQKRS